LNNHICKRLEKRSYTITVKFIKVKELASVRKIVLTIKHSIDYYNTSISSQIYKWTKYQQFNESTEIQIYLNI
jgi:hypothetical protein